MLQRKLWFDVGMYLRETRRRNRDGSTVSYLQLAHNERHPDTGAPTAKVIHNFGRAETVDRAGLARLVASICRFLDPADAVAAVAAADGDAGGQIEVLDSRRMGGAWVLDRLWDRLGIGAAVRAVAATRKIDPVAAERVILSMVAQRALEPGSTLACTRWVAERVLVEGVPGFSDDAAYRAMDFLLAALDEIAAGVFGSVATWTSIWSSWTPPARTGTSTPATSWPTRCAPSRTTTRCRSRIRPGRGCSGTPRTTGRICRRW